MRDVDVARRLLLSFGPNRFIVFGTISTIARGLLSDAGGEVLERVGTQDSDASARDDSSAWTPEFLGKSCLVCLNLSDDELVAVLSDERLSRTHGVYVQHRASAALDTTESLEQCAFEYGYRKHPSYYRIFGYAELDQISGELATLLEPVPLTARVRFQVGRLQEKRDRHPDMLREAGRRSDARLVRYDWASRFIRPGDVVLDAACGPGYGMHVIRSLSEAGRLYGIDRSEWAIDYATANFAGNNTEFIAGALPGALSRFENASVDVVMSFETLEHASEPSALLNEFQRILRPGGRVIVSAPNDCGETPGKHANPRQLHTYTYDRLVTEVGADYLVEIVARQTGSGCELADAEGERIERPRVLETVDPGTAAFADAECWLAVAMKSPETGRSLAYRETVHGCFEGASHLVDFAEHYTNPWLVHAMVEIPFRMQSADELEQLAERVLSDYPRETPDHGAALAVVSYRALEGFSDDQRLEQLDSRIADYLAISAANPHIQRWQVSLAYVRARLRLRRGDRAGALADFIAVAEADVAQITPTLGTKVIDAAFWAGVLSWLRAEREGARAWWRFGVTKAGSLLGSNWPEFFGNIEAPFAFAMNDAVELADRATASAQALSLTYRRDCASAERIYAICQQSLRSALRQRGADLISARAESTTLRREFNRVCQELVARNTQNEKLEGLAIERLEQIRCHEVRIEHAEGVLGEVTALAIQRLEENTALRARLDQTHTALDQTKALAMHRLEESAALDARLNKTEAAFEEAKELSFRRLEEKLALETRIEETGIALEEVKKLAIERLARIEVLERELAALTAGMTASTNATGRTTSVVDANAKTVQTTEYDSMR